jgi:hypothetical protein
VGGDDCLQVVERSRLLGEGRLHVGDKVRCQGVGGHACIR